MATLTVEGIPASLLAHLRCCAAGSGRSLNSEVIVQLVRSAAIAPTPDGGSGRVGGCCAAGQGCRCPGRHGGGAAANVGWGGPPAARETGRRLRL